MLLADKVLGKIHHRHLDKLMNWITYCLNQILDQRWISY
jgi:hypothetical protein